MGTDVQTKVAKFFSQFPLKKFKKGEILIQPDETMRGAHYVKSGYVREYSISSDGVEVTLHIFTPNSYFPMTWILNDVKNRYFYEALTDSEIVVAPKKDVLKFLQSHADVVMDLTSRLLQGLDKLVLRIEYLALANASKKILSTLLFLARHFGKESKNTVMLTQKFTHTDIASFAGVTRETASRELEKLRKQGLIETGEQFLIKDINELRTMLST